MTRPKADVASCKTSAVDRVIPILGVHYQNLFGTVDGATFALIAGVLARVGLHVGSVTPDSATGKADALSAAIVRTLKNGKRQRYGHLA